MNKPSIYQTIVETYNISPNDYPNNIDFNNSLNEKTLMNIIFSKYITDNEYNYMNENYIKYMLKSSYIYMYENANFLDNTNFYEDNMKIKNRNDQQDFMPHTNKLVTDFDLINYASVDVINFFVYLDIIIGIYDRVYNIDKKQYKSITEIEIPIRYKADNNGSNITIFDAGSYDIILEIKRRDDIYGDIIDIDINNTIWNNKFKNAFKMDIMKHLNFLAGEDVSYATKKYLQDICYFYKYCRLRFMYCIIHAIYLVSIKPKNPFDISSSVIGYIKTTILPVFINFKDLINIKLDTNKYETSKNLVYNETVMQTTNKLSSINSKILNEKAKLTKNRRINNVVKNNTSIINNISKLSLLIFLITIILLLILIALPIQSDAKGLLSIILSAIILIIYIILRSYLKSIPNTEEHFNTENERLANELRLTKEENLRSVNELGKGDLQSVLNNGEVAKKNLETATRIYNDAVKALDDSKKAFEKAKQDLENDKSNAEKKYKLDVEEKNKRNAELDLQLKEADKLNKEKIAEAILKEDEALKRQETLNTISDTVTQGITSINTLQQSTDNVLDKLQKHLNSTSDTIKAQTVVMKAENALALSIELAKKNINIANVEYQGNELINQLNNDLTVQNARYQLKIANKNLEEQTKRETMLKKEAELALLESNNLASKNLDQTLKDSIERMRTTINNNEQRIKNADKTYNDSIKNIQNIENRISQTLSTANKDFNITGNIDEVNMELESRLAREINIKAEAERDIIEQQNKETESASIIREADLIINEANRIINEKQIQIGAINKIISANNDELENLEKQRRDTERRLNEIKQQNRSDIENAENKYIEYEYETRIKILNLTTEKRNLITEFYEKEEIKKQKEIDFLESKARRDVLEDELAKQQAIFKKLSDEVDYQKDILQEYNITYIMIDIGVLLLNNINDNINGINHDLIIPMLNIEQSAFDKYSNDIMSYSNKAKNDINVQKINLQESLAVINLYISISLLFPSCLSIYYLLSTIFSISFGVIFGVIIIVNYVIQTTGIVRTKAINKYWSQPSNYVNYLQ